MRRALATLLIWTCAALFLPATGLAQDAAPAFKKEEIEQLVAPIALYPDPLVAQILMASTYPLEIVEAARWVKANPDVKGDAVEKAMEGQKWDPSVKSLAAFPQVLTMLNEKLDMTQKMGDAFLGQQKEVMDAIQRLRGKADQAGNLKSGKEQTVTKTQEEGASVIKIEPTQPTTVYVPTNNPAVVYGPWPYTAYPPYYYYPPGYVAGATFFSFAVGVAVGNAMWGNCNWGRGDVNINVNKYNNFNKTNISNNNWSHNAEHRKGVQYRDQASQQKFGKGQREGAQSREQFRGRAEQGRQEIAHGGADNFKGGGADGLKGNAGGASQRDLGGRNEGMNRDAGGRNASGGHSGAFEGAGGGQSRQMSDRGASSRASAGSHGGRSAGGGGRAGGGGGRRR
jgi:hypothetical protein